MASQTVQMPNLSVVVDPDPSTTTSSTLSPTVTKVNSTPQQILQRLPKTFAALSDADFIDNISNTCSSEILVIVKNGHSLIDYTTTTLDDYLKNDKDFHHDALPNFKVIDNFDFGSLTNDSEIDIYIKLAKLIGKYYFLYDGFCIIERVDKLAYTASYLSFMLENLGKCVVFTSSTSKIADAFNDAKSNLISSLIIAGRSDINEVCVCFNRKVYRGNRVIRHDQSSHHAFASPNFGYLAEFGTALTINYHLLLPVVKKGFKVFLNLYRDIIVLYLTPVTNILLLKLLLCGSAVNKKKGIVLSFYGAGNAPQSSQLKNVLIECISTHKSAIVITTQCLHGHVNMSVYATGSFFGGIGLINGMDMTIEAIVAKLSYLMGKGFKGNELKNKFETNLIGEVTPIHLIKGRIVDYKNKNNDHHGVNNVKFMNNDAVIKPLSTIHDNNDDNDDDDSDSDSDNDNKVDQDNNDNVIQPT